MIIPKVQIVGLENVARAVGAFDDASRKALNTAIRVEGYRLMRLMQRQVRHGAPGGRRFAPLSFIARVMGHRGKNEPLKALSQAIKYLVPKPDPIEFHFGFVGPVNRSQMRAMHARKSQLISKSWVHIAAAQQAGFETPLGDRVIQRGRYTFGARLAHWGASQEGRRGVHHSRGRYFFLRRSTKALKTPARPIIAPFWQAEERGVMQHIRENFRRKLAGERI